MPRERKKIDHLAIARDFLNRASKLRELLQKRGIPKHHRDYKRIELWKQHAEKHMLKHRDTDKPRATETFGFTANMRNPYLTTEEGDPNKQQGSRKGFKEFTKDKEDTPEKDSNNSKIGSKNDSGEEIKELSGKKEKIIINPQLRTIQVNLPGGQQK
jgi:hypothetical protein